MKKQKLIIFLMLMFFGSYAFSQNITKTIKFEMPEIVALDDGYSSILYKDAKNFGDEGTPKIPHFSLSTLLPPGCEIENVKIVSQTFYAAVDGISIQASARQFPLSKMPGNDEYKVVPNQEIYSSNQPFPANPIENISTHFLAGHAIGSFSICPISFIPADQQVDFLKEIVLEISLTSTSNAVEAQKFLRNSTIIENRINNIVDNPEALSDYSYDASQDDGEMDILLITQNSFVASFEPYISFKESTGFVCGIKTTEEIYSEYSGQDNQEKIRNCIIDFYENYGISYVILGGDGDGGGTGQEIIPHRGFWDNAYGENEYDIPADIYYSNLDGNWNTDGDNKWGEPNEADLYSELSIGRVCADNTSKVLNHVNKLQLYQNAPVVDDIEKALFLGELLWNDPTWGGDYKDEVADGSSNHGYTTVGLSDNITCTRLYERDMSWSKQDIFNQASNVGVNLRNHLGHSNVDYNMLMYNSDLTTSNFQNNGITRGFMIGYSQGCYNGAFDNRGTGGYEGDCFSEKITTIATADVATIGNSRYGWGQHSSTDGASQYFDRQFYDAIFGEDITEIGTANADSKEDNVPFINGSAIRWCFYELNLFGDPSMDIWTATPTDFAAQYPASMPIGSNQFAVQTYVPFARVALVQEGVLIGRGLADEFGEVIVNMFSPVVNPLPISISIIGHNKNRHQNNIVVVSDEPYVIFDSKVINDNAGNGNGMLDYGEDVSLSVGLKNVGNQPTTGVVATISTENPYVTFTDNTEPYGDFDPEEVIYIEDAFAFSVSSNVPDGENIAFTIAAESGETSWESYFSIIAHAPVLNIVEFEILGNGGIDPGETTDVSIIVKNSGSCEAADAFADLSSISPYLSINSGSQSLGNINPDGSVDAIFSITAASGTPIGQVADLIFDITAANDYNVVETKYVTIGIIFEDFESGDFTSFDWTFSGNANWQVVNTNAYEGVYCAKSGSIGNNAESILILELEVLSSGEISFFKKVSCEDDPGGAGYDYLAFSIDNSEKGKWDGEVSWSEEVFTVSAGSHTFKWTYHKDGYVTGGSDCVWIDYIVLPPIQPDEVTQTIPLNTGYQFVSSRIDVTNPDMLVVLQGILNENLDFVRNSEGTVLRKIGPNWVNGIGDWISTEGYLIKMYGSETLALTGDVVNPLYPINLTMGYQFVSFLPEVSIDAIVAFEGILSDDLDYIRNSNGEMLRKIGPNWVNGFGDANPGEGYLIKMYADDLLVYNIPTEITKSSTLDKVMNHFAFEGGNAADPVYSIYVSGLNIGDEVAVYDGEKMVGASVVVSENVLENSVPVFSTLTSGEGYKEGNEISMKVWDSNSTKTVEADFTFETEYEAYSEKVFPTEDGKYSIANVIKASSVSINEILIYPNPATDLINISSANEIQNISIFNYVGQTIYNGTDKKINTSNFEAGIYLIKIETKEGIETQKITIN